MLSWAATSALFPLLSEPTTDSTNKGLEQLLDEFIIERGNASIQLTNVSRIHEELTMQFDRAETGRISSEHVGRRSKKSLATFFEGKHMD